MLISNGLTLLLTAWQIAIFEIQALNGYEHKIQQRIVNGNPVGNAIDYQALIKINGSFRCGGTLVTRDVVITAAHCAENVNVNDYQIEFGVYDRSNYNEVGKISRDVTMQLMHPEYDEEDVTNDHDILLLYLDEAVTEYDAIDLNKDGSLLQKGDLLTVSGWGNAEVGGDPADKLMSVDVEYIPNDECADMFSSLPTYVIEDWHLCAFTHSSGACQGDSGGPLVLPADENTVPLLVGLVSFGIGCGNPTYPSIFMKMSYYNDWIKSNICFEFSGSYSFCADFDFPSQSPFFSLQPTVLCTDFTGYEDSVGDDCAWYEENDLEGCPTYGDQDSPLMNSPNDACCYCGGGLPIKVECTDIPGFVDSGGDSCAWYTRYDSYGCPTYGSSFSNRETGLAASDACCYCGGGIEGSVSVPSSSPSLSLSPSNSILSLPTKKPTTDPTALPTLTPTKQPTILPTQMPTSDPTALPTNKPSVDPTVLPTIVSTKQPTLLPTQMRTSDPTTLPTNKPTVDPTVLPTLTTTIQPSFLFSQTPTSDPTALSTLTPTTLPTQTPTVDPTALPTKKPTPGPTVLPTLTPITQPTLLPTQTPTIDPTTLPTNKPSVDLTALPTLTSTIRNSFLSSQTPTVDPTALPTKKPTADPTVLPTLTPITQPTLLPTQTPTIDPTALPTNKPTADLTTLSTLTSTIRNSFLSSQTPTDDPIALPTKPTADPTALLTLTPTTQPTLLPTKTPTVDSTALPTNKPTADLTALPTLTSTIRNDPTEETTLIPTIRFSAGPIALPTKNPITYPTAFPKIWLSADPTALHTRKPSADQTASPTNNFTFKPSGFPTKTLTNEPTSIYEPTYEPTELLIRQPTFKPIIVLSPQPNTTSTNIPSETSTGQPSPSIPSLVPSSSYMKKLTDGPSINPSQLSYLTPSFSVSSRPTSKLIYESSSIRPSLLSISPTQNEQNYSSTNPTRLSSFPPSLRNNINSSSTHLTPSLSSNVFEELSMDPSVSTVALPPLQPSLPSIRSSMPTDMIKGTPKVSVNGSLSISSSAFLLILFCFLFLFAFT